MPYKDPEKRRAQNRKWHREHSEYMRVYMKEWRMKNPTRAAEIQRKYMQRVRQLVASLKLERGNRCVDCSAVFDDPAMLDFDHIDPSTKTLSFGALCGNTPAELIKAEAEKCELRCPNCHRARTLRENHMAHRRTA